MASTTRRDFLKVAGTSIAAVAQEEHLKAQQPSLDDLLTIPWDNNTLNFIHSNKNCIVQSADRYNLPAEFLASVIYYESLQNGFLSRFKDRAMRILNMDPTLGPAQVRLSVAALMDCRQLAKCAARL